MTKLEELQSKLIAKGDQYIGLIEDALIQISDDCGVDLDELAPEYYGADEIRESITSLEKEIKCRFEFDLGDTVIVEVTCHFEKEQECPRCLTMDKTLYEINTKSRHWPVGIHLICTKCLEGVKEVRHERNDRECHSHHKGSIRRNPRDTRPSLTPKV